MNTLGKALAVYGLFFSLLLSGCGATQVISPTVAPTATITYVPQVEATKEPERAPDGNRNPYPYAFLPSERGHTTSIRQLAADIAFTDKISSEAQSQLGINSGNVDIVGFRLIGDKTSTYYILVGDRSNDKFYSTFSTNEDGFYSPINRDGNVVFLPMSRQDKDGQVHVGFDVEGDLLLPPTFVYKNGILLFTDPKTGEKVVMSTGEEWSHKVLSLLTNTNTPLVTSVVDNTPTPETETAQWEKAEISLVPGKLPTPEQPLTPKQQARFEYIRKNLEIGGYFSDASLFEVSFNADDKAVITDRVSGRVLSVDLKWNYLDPDNVSGKDQLEDGSWVFNYNLQKRLANEGLEKTHLKGINGVRNNPSSEVDSYTREILSKVNTDSPGVLEQLVGGLSDNESFSGISVLLYTHPDGTYSWGKIVGKRFKNESWVESKRVLVYKDVTGTIKYIPVYYPNYLIYR
jgi:hypothetical protein